MHKLRRLSGKEVCQILVTQGFVKVRQKRSHVIMQKSIKGTTITVPIPDHNELKIGTLNGIIRQSGVSHSLFESA